VRVTVTEGGEAQGAGARTERPSTLRKASRQTVPRGRFRTASCHKAQQRAAAADGARARARVRACVWRLPLGPARSPRPTSNSRSSRSWPRKSNTDRNSSYDTCGVRRAVQTCGVTGRVTHARIQVCLSRTSCGCACGLLWPVPGRGPTVVEWIRDTRARVMHTRTVPSSLTSNMRSVPLARSTDSAGATRPTSALSSCISMALRGGG
jgi:hypothetical protein